MDDTPTTSKKRGRRADATTPVDMAEEVDDELVAWPSSTSKKGNKRRKSEPNRTRERSSSTRATSVDTTRRSASRVPDGADTETDARKDEATDDDRDEDDGDDDSDMADGDALADDEFSRQQAIYAAQQRSMGYVYIGRRLFRMHIDLHALQHTHTHAHVSLRTSLYSLLSHLMDDDQLERHMASRRGTLNKGGVRKVCIVAVCAMLFFFFSYHTHTHFLTLSLLTHRTACQPCIVAVCKPAHCHGCQWCRQGVRG